MKLALEIPLNYWDIFFPLEDFHYVLIDFLLKNKAYREKYTNLPKDKKDVWLDNSFNELKVSAPLDHILKGIDILNPTHVVTLEKATPSDNLVAIEKTLKEFSKRGIKVKTVGCWKGTKWEVKLLKEMVDIIGFPYDLNRVYGLDQIDSRLTHYFGFKNLDELKKNPPNSLDTSVPIRAAMLGISLSERKRRPKHLPLYTPSLTLSSSQIELAKENIEVIKSCLT